MKKATLAAMFLAALVAGGLAQVRVGALSEDVSQWQEVAARAQAGGLSVTVAGYSESALYQQVYILSSFGMAKVDLVEVPTKWLPQVLGRLLDLSPYEKELIRQGLAPVSYYGRIVGVKLPWREDAFAAILARSSRADEALEVLGYLSPEGTTTPGTATATAIAIPLRIGSITMTKPAQNLPGVDGALEMFVSAMKQTVAQGAVQALSHLPSAAREALATVAEMMGVPLTSGGGEVVVVLETRGGVSAMAAGAREAVSSASGLIKAVVPLSNLESFLAQVSGYAYVRLPYEPFPLATSEGAGLVGASAFHAQGIRGAGVKVAIIDLGFKGLSASQARGDLPYSVITKDFTGTGIEAGISHGTAVAEIVHDIAPDAQLYLIKIGNEVDLDNAVTYCIQQGVDIINHSLGWYNTNFYDGSGTICDIARRATSAGILWVQAAGNDAQKHWEGSFTDTNSDGWLDTELTFSANSGDPILLYLTWDGWPQTADDYDLYLYGPGGTLIASSTKTQGGTEEPTERVSTTASASGTYRVRIQLASGSARKLELFSLYHELSPGVTSSSIPAPGNLADALTVGAVDWRSYTTGPVEPYSSRGPTNDGRTKPDLVAPDNVTTGVLPYYAPFPGTSAAAPHVAGIAALLLSEDPTLSLSALRNKILSMCVTMGDANSYGAGRLVASPQAVALPDLVIQDIQYTPASPTVGQTITFQVTVHNQGTAPAGQFSVSLASSTKTVYGLAAGANYTLTFYATLTSSSETFTATADVFDQVTEANETNNTSQVTVSTLAALVAEAGGPYYGTAGQPITFDGRSSQGAITSYTWDFGDGTSASGAIVSHVYASPGTYTARLTVRDSYGHIATDTAQVTVSPPSLPDLVIDQIAYSPSSPTVGQTVTFQVTVRNAGGTPAGAFYIRLEGAAGHQNAYISGLGAGASHTVTLTLPLSAATETFTATADYYGQVAESNETNNQRQVTIAAAAPPISFSLALDRPSYTVGDPVRITVVLSRAAYVYLVEIDPTGKATLIFPNYWERDPRLPAGTTQLPRASYTITASTPAGTEELYGFASETPIPYFPTSFSPGFPTLATNGANFLAQVRAWLQANVPAGSWAEASTLFTVTSAANLPPRARFTYSPGSPSVGQWIQFDASGSSDPDGTIVSYEWSFGDGTTASGVRVNKRYNSAGSYTVRLTVRDDRGATDSATKTVTVGTVNQPPQAGFTFSPASPDPGDVVHFNASASSDPDGSITSYTWDFGDGTTGSGVTANHAFPAAGTYTVTLTVRDNEGATDTESKTIQVGTPTTLPGMPVIDQPGIYVWGDAQRWHITVVGDPSWSSPRPFRIEVSGRGGTFRGVKVTPGSAPAPEVAQDKRSLSWEGTIQRSWVDLEFQTTVNFMLLALYLDVDGDGDPQPTDPEWIYLRQYKVNPPVNPFIIGVASPTESQVRANWNFKIGSGSLSAIVWLTTIEQLEGGHR
jgi:PKD repeat protein